MPVTALLTLFITAVLAGLVCYIITSKLDDRRYQRQLRRAREQWHDQLAEYSTFFLGDQLEDTAARWADTM